MKRFKAFLLLAFIGLLFVTKTSFALPFSIVPSVPLPTTVQNGYQTQAVYTVTNVTNQAAPSSFVKFLPPNVKQVIDTTDATLCGTLFNLAPAASCKLKLVIAGPVYASDTNPEHHLFVCRQDGKTCAGPSQQLNVTTINLLSITVLPATPSFPKGTTQQFSAVGTFSDGSSHPLTTVTWSSSSVNITFTPPANTTGLATGALVGVATVTATQSAPLPAVSGSTTATVTAATLLSIAITPVTASIANGTTLSYTAMGTFSDGLPPTNITATVFWFSSLPTVAAIVPFGATGGQATGMMPGGPSDITAMLGLITSDLPNPKLTVTPATLVSFAITPLAPSILVGATQAFTATGTFSDLTTQNITNSVVWSSATPSVATIAPTGVATGLGLGTSSINATSNIITNPPTPPMPAVAPATLTVDLVSPQKINAGTSTSTGFIFSSINSGNTWTSETIAPAAPITGLASADGYVYAAGGATFNVYRSSAIAFALSFTGTIRINAIDARSTNNVYIGLQNSTVCYSTDNGVTFPICSAAMTGSSPVISLAHDTANLYAGTISGRICTGPLAGIVFTCTVNTGDSTNALATLPGYVFAGKASGDICISTDAGTSFPNCVTPAPASGIKALTKDTAGHLFAGRADGKVCVSHNAGGTFTCADVKAPGDAVLSLAADANGVIYAGTTSGNVCWSTNIGVSWLCPLISPTPGVGGLPIAALSVRTP